NIDRKDLETIWKLVKAKHGNIWPKDAYKRVMWGDLKVMFKPDKESEVWRNLQGHKVTVWKLFSSCGVHFIKFENLHIFMLVEKKYPLTPATITDMLNKKLKADYWNEMCYQLLKLMIHQTLRVEQDIMQSKCVIVNVSSTTDEKHLKRLKDLSITKGYINMGLWYPKDSGFELTAFSDVDHAGYLDTRKSTSRGIHILDNSSKAKLWGRVLESFQEDAKYEHVGQDTRSQGGKDDQD
ncbi:hypothetical protein Tco_0848805, partial [Tanacetum coccineum]